jgi:monofunctional biosynthetic peptidoglycan transglycosylase
MAKKRKRKGWLFRIVRFCVVLGLLIYCALAAFLVLLRWINPLTTSVQIQRRLESLGGKYQKRYNFVPLSRISVHLQHAVVAAEDGRFFAHSGVDWKELEKVIGEEFESGRFRGASTISQQLVKNLFFTTGGSVFRKAAEFATVPVAEAVLSKQRILELYLNVIEWGPGVFGAEAAAAYHYGGNAASLTREQAARLASILPNPIRRKPERMDRYTSIILERMAKMGW